jgi:CNT family concentrative nucleoside transporter
MSLISILGLLALLGIAWAISYDRRGVRLRPVLWGLGLQLIFALIILRADEWSFVGMGVFATLVLGYLLRPTVDAEPVQTWLQRVALVLAGGAAVTFATVKLGLDPSIVGWLWVALLPTAWVLGKFEIWPAIHRYVAASIVVLAVAYLIGSSTVGREIFEAMSSRIAAFLNLSDYGARFIFGNLADEKYFFPDDGLRGFGFQFGFKVLPTIIFFGGFMGVLYYLGVIQKVISGIAGFMRWTFGTSGAETLSCSANIFVGQTEAPLLIRPFISSMTKSELLTIMVGGFATIAGGVLAGYIAMGVPAGHLVAATVMSAPAALAISKIIFPEKEHSATAGDLDMPEIDVGANAIEAASSGITDGLKLAVNVGAMLIGFIALINVLDLGLNALDRLIDGDLIGGGKAVYREYATSGMSVASGEYEGYFPGSLQTLFGTALKPLAYLIGVPWEDADKVGNLLGIKLSLNEFVSFGTLGTYIQEQAISQRAIVISTYALCGFANFSSIGIQIGGLSALAPDRRSDLAKVGLRAMIGGALASWTTATVAGILI